MKVSFAQLGGKGKIYVVLNITEGFLCVENWQIFE